MTSKIVNEENPALNAKSRRISGQGMTEYIIIVALIALAAITVVGVFGNVVQSQFGRMAQTLSGGQVDIKTDELAKTAKTAAGAKTLSNY